MKKEETNKTKKEDLSFRGAVIGDKRVSIKDYFKKQSHG